MLHKASLVVDHYLTQFVDRRLMQFVDCRLTQFVDRRLTQFVDHYPMEICFPSLCVTDRQLLAAWRETLARPTKTERRQYVVL